MGRKLGKLNETVIRNMLGAFIVKGGSLVLSVLLLPAYIRFFNNETILGIWYTLLSVLSWILNFDLGLGQGLRNQLPPALERNDRQLAKQYISTTYIVMLALAAGITALGLAVIPRLSWNGILNVSEQLVENAVLVRCVRIVFTGIMLQMVLKIITFVLYAIQRSAVVNLLGMISNVIIFAMISILPSADVATNLYRMSLVNVAAVNLPLIAATALVFLNGLRDAAPSFRAFRRKLIGGVLNVGLTLLWLQLAFMVVSTTNEFLITRLCGPEAVVDYQIYNKIFKTAAMVVSLALTPVWSAVTKAQAQKNYGWIRKIYGVFGIGTALCFAGELCIIPILQWLVDLWLGKGMIDVNPGYALAFVFSSTVFVLHYVNTAIGNGMSYFRVQTVWMTFAAAAFIPASVLLVNLTGSWIGVVIANVLVMIPYEIIAPVSTLRMIRRKMCESGQAGAESPGSPDA